MIRDSGAPRRVLWLLNHTTLRECEVPLLQSMGFEIFTPKRFPRSITEALQLVSKRMRV